MTKAIRSPERFCEDATIPCILIKASFDIDDKANRFVRMDFETPVREAYKHLPEGMQQVYDTMGNAGAINTKFAVEFPNRLVELSFDPKKNPAKTIDSTIINRVEFRRQDTEHEMKLRFSITESAVLIGHWVVDHFGDPMFFHAIHAQMSIGE